ncbi:MAG: ribosome biogenesis GTPase Der, partial [Myxococcaceae bacterium]
MPATVAIVGRPNVGKSTLFNRLTRFRRAITHDLPGVTRDRVAADAPRPAGGTVVVVDTGGFEPDSEAPIPVMIRDQALVAVAGADAVVLVVDGAVGLVPADEELARALHKAGTPAVVVVNKQDRRDAALGFSEFLALGFPVVSVSAEHGLGIGDLWDELEKVLPPPQEEAPVEAELAVAIVGRPHVGKSSLLNRLLGEERVLVSEVPGTTRDTVDTLVACGHRTVRLIDTAGIRRKGRTDKGPEVLSVVMARRAIERAQVCLLVVDAGEGLTAQDTHVAGYVSEAGRGVVIVFNKADLIEDQGREGRQGFRQKVLERLKFLKDTPVVFVSAVTGAGIP